MDNLMVKPVDVLGSQVMAARDLDGEIWAGISYFCNALGMQKWQKDKQIQKVQNDKALSRGCSKFGAGVFDPNNETVALRIDFIPMWLAKINITPTMEKDHPDLADKLLEYQLKAKDILAAAFLPKQNNFPRTTQAQIQLLAQGNVELNQRVDEVTEDVKTVKQEIEALRDDLPLFPSEADKISNAAKRKGVEVLGGKQSNAYKNRSLQHKVYSNIYANLKYNFKVNTYKAIRRGNQKEALQIVENYQPPFFLQTEIENANAQLSLNLEGGATE